MRRTARFLLYTLRPWLLILPISVTSAVLLLPRLAGGADGPVAALCNALPGFGKVKTEKLMEELGIPAERRLQGLGSNQMAALKAALS